MDYAFTTAEDVGEDMCPVLIGYGHDSRGIWAIAVEAKGAVKSSVQFVKDKIDNAGCSGTSISLRSDQEDVMFEAFKPFGAKVIGSLAQGSRISVIDVGNKDSVLLPLISKKSLRVVPITERSFAPSAAADVKYTLTVLSETVRGLRDTQDLRRRTEIIPYQLKIPTPE